ncbi:MAG TPA: bifunctional heptose 7-phosphate kinase/heptose 1-phosphate adenyltransferase [Deltaproteobacteria bacterium]|nr:bifunctional heptose 7-phosphate kinase/heptose 1-phosphate adenyltransferase [Deltaproteobacteria bacterium]
MTPQELRNALETVEAPRILVVGDIMLDRYSWGTVERISPEAPIPVLRVLREDQRLGGAGNVMMNLSALGAEVLACGALGNDEVGHAARNLMAEHQIGTEGVVNSSNNTVLKHRMIAGHTHLLRMDVDPSAGARPPEEQALLQYLQATIPTVHAVLVSDYGKGTLSNSMLRTIAALGKTHSVPIIADPRRNVDYGIYQDFRLIKPNRKEAEFAVGFTLKDHASVLRAAQHLKYQIGVEYVVISLDKEGLLLFQDSQNYQFFGAETQEVFDVVGAGDMVISVLAFMLAGGTPIEHAAYWSQLAASMEVQHVGVVSFTKSELLHRFEFGESSSKIVTLEQLCRYLPHQDLPVVFTNGYFDEISSGHLKFLHQLQSFKGFNVVGINSDRMIEEQKGHSPLLNERERALLLSSVEAVNRVVIFDEPNAEELILRMKPDIVVKGERYRNQEIPETAAIKTVDAKLEYLQKY